MWLDALALGILAVFATLGAIRGGLATGLSLLSLVVAYAAALTLGPALGPTAATALGFPEMLGIPIVGTIAALVAFTVMGIFASVARRRSAAAVALGAGRSARDRFAGGLLGLVRGGLLVVLVSWLAIWVDALRETGTTSVPLPELGDSRAAAVAESAVEAAVEAALSDAGPAAKLAARIAARPGHTLSGVREVVDSPKLARLGQDRMFWTYVEAGAIDSALNQGSFLDITRDAALREQLADLGLIDEGAVSDPRAFRDAAHEVLSEVGPRVKALREDPAFQRLMQDDEVVAMVANGDTLGLMAHPAFREVIASATADE